MKIVSSLRSKIIISVSAILAVTIGLGTWLNIGHQRLQMEEALEDNVLIISNTIERSLSDAMLNGKSKEVQDILMAVGGYHNIREVKIFSPDGTILKSSKPWMIGTKIDEPTGKWFRSNIFKTPIKRRDEGIFSVLFPIENEARCFRCHSSKIKLNGILSVNVSMAQTRQKLGNLTKTMVLWAFGITAVLAISLSLFLTHFVTNPIRALITTMERAEQGLEARVNVKSSDDIGLLGLAFNSLLSRLEQARKREERYHYEQMSRADRLASIGEMAAGIAHEIKNPLTGIAGVIQLMKKDMPSDSRKRAVLEEALAQVERMDKAVRNLLSFARPPEPKLTLVDINDVTGKLLDFLSTQFAKHSILVERKLTPGLPSLTLDPNLIQQGLINIVLNAIQAMQDGGKLTIETKTTKNGEDGRTLDISFSDTGKGISREDMEKIFNPFFTTRQRGTGLGLAITRRIVEQHNGEISVTSDEGQGACFTISLPCPDILVIRGAQA